MLVRAVKVIGAAMGLLAILRFADLLPALCSPDELDLLKRDPRHGRLLVPPLSG